MLVSGIVSLPLLLPVVPPSTVGALGLQSVNYNLGEEIGWPRVHPRGGRGVGSLPASARGDGSAKAVIVTENYGEAGAHRPIRCRSGPARRVLRTQLVLFVGCRRPADRNRTVAVGLDRSHLMPYFAPVQLAGRIHNDAGVENDENGAPIWICTGQIQTWPQMWSHFKHYG